MQTAKTKRIADVGAGVSVHYCAEWQEYQVKVAGRPAATYHTDNKEDAFRTAQRMRNTAQAVPHD